MTRLRPSNRDSLCWQLATVREISWQALPCGRTLIGRLYVFTFSGKKLEARLSSLPKPAPFRLPSYLSGLEMSILRKPHGRIHCCLDLIIAQEPTDPTVSGFAYNLDSHMS
jgi:hypothetical protein